MCSVQSIVQLMAVNYGGKMMIEKSRAKKNKKSSQQSTPCSSELRGIEARVCVVLIMTRSPWRSLGLSVTAIAIDGDIPRS